MCTDATDAAIVYATIQLAGKLGIRVVAEGVEDEATWEALRELDCDLIQGYLLSRPLPAAELERSCSAPPSASHRPEAGPARAQFTAGSGGGELGVTRG